MKRDLAGLGASVCSRRGFEWASAVASATGAELLVINAFRPGEAEVPAGCYAELLAKREAEVASWLGEVGEVSMTIEVHGGDPRPRLRDLAAEREVDLLVVDHHGTSGEPGFLHLGSVAEYVGHQATVPLAVIPAERPAQLERFVLGVNGSDDSVAAARWCAPLAAATRSTVWAMCAPEPLLRWAPDGTPVGWVKGTQHNLIEDWTVDLARAALSSTRRRAISASRRRAARHSERCWCRAGCRGHERARRIPGASGRRRRTAGASPGHDPHRARSR